MKIKPNFWPRSSNWIIVISKREHLAVGGNYGQMVEEQSNWNMWWAWYVKVYRLQRVKAIEPAQKHQLIHRRQHVTQWLERQQIEKRRKEQLRQRKKGAKKKPLGDGIQVDTKISKSDAFSKCGLKPKTVQQQADTAANSKTRKRNTNESEPQRQNPAFA